jgi:hypothetical protein
MAELCSSRGGRAVNDLTVTTTGLLRLLVSVIYQLPAWPFLGKAQYVHRDRERNFYIRLGLTA